MVSFASILYIPRWEKPQLEWIEHNCSILSKYGSVLVILDGHTEISIPKEAYPFFTPKSEGPIFLLQQVLSQLAENHFLFLRQGTKIEIETLEPFIADSMAYLASSPISKSDIISDSCIFFTKELIPVLTKIPPILCLGYGAALTAILDKSNIDWGKIQCGITINPILPTAYIQQQMANTLSGFLTKLTSQPPIIVEKWYTPSTEKVSIIVLVWNNLKVTIPCLLSIMKYTFQPFELIIIDNGSEENVEGWVQKKLRKFTNVIYHRNDINQGFPQGCNDGINLATGEHILLLNNDTIVTPFWLSRLMGAFADQKIGMVGPMSVNNGSDQNIGVIPYKNPKEMLIFSAHYSRHNLGSITDVSVIIGLCMLIHNKVWTKLGGLDPIYGFGNGEDSDYCIRCQRLGFTVAVVQDIFIDHIGSVTFSNSQLPYDKMLQQNFCYSVLKHLPESERETIIAIARQKDSYSVQSGDWKHLREWNEKWDKIPLQIIDCLSRDEETQIQLPVDKTLIAFPSPYEDWIPIVQKSLAEDWHIVLRIEPPVDEFRLVIEQQITESFTTAQQSKMYIDYRVLPTKERGKIYCQASAGLRLPRFDHFRFDRELSALQLPIIN
jgi:GT2 family glycosyltransferase